MSQGLVVIGVGGCCVERVSGVRCGRFAIAVAVLGIASFLFRPLLIFVAFVVFICFVCCICCCVCFRPLVIVVCFHSSCYLCFVLFREFVAGVLLNFVVG